MTIVGQCARRVAGIPAWTGLRARVAIPAKRHVGRPIPDGPKACGADRLLDLIFGELWQASRGAKWHGQRCHVFASSHSCGNLMGREKILFGGKAPCGYGSPVSP